MITAITILAYVVSIFLNRFLNKVGYKHGFEINVYIWFVPIIPAIVLIAGLIEETWADWFKGKHWER